MQVTVVVASDVTEADEIQSLLAEAGITSQLERAEGDGAGPVGDGPCRVLVPSEDVEAAMDVLAAAAEQEDADEGGGGGAAW